MEKPVTSSRIDLQKLNNTRDLGGMRTKDGHTIIPGRLIRSGHLFYASAEDIAWLSGHAGLIVDFRTEKERQEKPDPAVPYTDALQMPVFESLAAGVSRDEKSDEAAFAIVAANPEKARRYMVNTYLGFVTNDFSVSQYRRFINLLLTRREKAVLWHCTAGKDRAGFASVIVEEILGVSRDDITADYLKSNEYLADEIRQLYAMVSRRAGSLGQFEESALNYLFGAHEEFLGAIYEKTETLYGGFDGFLEKGLGISLEQAEMMRTLYLV